MIMSPFTLRLIVLIQMLYITTVSSFIVTDRGTQNRFKNHQTSGKVSPSIVLSSRQGVIPRIDKVHVILNEREKRQNERIYGTHLYSTGSRNDDNITSSSNDESTTVNRNSDAYDYKTDYSQSSNGSYNDQFYNYEGLYPVFSPTLSNNDQFYTNWNEYSKYISEESIADIISSYNDNSDPPTLDTNQNEAPTPSFFQNEEPTPSLFFMTSSNTLDTENDEITSSKSYDIDDPASLSSEATMINTFETETATATIDSVSSPISSATSNSNSGNNFNRNLYDPPPVTKISESKTIDSVPLSASSNSNDPTPVTKTSEPKTIDSVPLSASSVDSTTSVVDSGMKAPVPVVESSKDDKPVSPSSSSSTSTTSTKTSTSKGIESNSESASLSDLDARVLQSILQDKTLDFATEENLKKLLERGSSNQRNNVKSSSSSTSPTSSDDTTNKKKKYSSSFFQSIGEGDNIWSSFKSKFDEVVESAKIYIQNRIEIDSKLLAFTFTKVLDEVVIALPASSAFGSQNNNTTMKQILFRLSNSTSSMMQTGNQFVLPSISSYNENINKMKEKKRPKTLYEELNKPMDEINIVTESIRDLLSGKSSSTGIGTTNTYNRPNIFEKNRRTLRSIAPAGSSFNSERQRLAYERKKNTVLKREKENINAKLGRAVNTVSDAAWELNQELRVEKNKPGYKADPIRKRLLAQSSIIGNALLGPAKSKNLNLLKSAIEEKSDLNLLKSAGEETSDVTNTEPLLKEMKTAVPFFVNELEQDVTTPKIPPEGVEVVKLENDPDKNMVFKITTESLLEEQARFAASLRLCLERPDQTWLLPSVISMESNEDGTLLDEGEEDPESLREVISAMIVTRDSIDSGLMGAMKDLKYTQSKIVSELQSMKESINRISMLAVTSAGALAGAKLKQELMGLNDGGKMSLLSSLDEIVDSIESSKSYSKQVNKNSISSPSSSQRRRSSEPFVVNDMSASESDGKRINSFFQNSEIINDIDDDPKIVDFTKDYNEEVIQEEEEIIIDAEIFGFTEATVIEVLPAEKKSKKEIDKPFYIDQDVEFEVLRNTPNKPSSIEDDDFDDPNFFAEVELVLDDDDEVFESKTVKTAAVEDGDNESKDNPVINVTLRAIDVVLFILEKTLVVGLPGIINSWKLATARSENIRRDGMGVEGWELLANINDGKKRY